MVMAWLSGWLSPGLWLLNVASYWAVASWQLDFKKQSPESLSIFSGSLMLVVRLTSLFEYIQKICEKYLLSKESDILNPSKFCCGCLQPVSRVLGLKALIGQKICLGLETN